MISTQYNNVSNYADFVDMLCEYVHGVDTSLHTETTPAVNGSIQANLEDIGYGE